MHFVTHSLWPFSQNCISRPNPRGIEQIFFLSSLPTPVPSQKQFHQLNCLDWQVCSKSAFLICVIISLRDSYPKTWKGLNFQELTCRPPFCQDVLYYCFLNVSFKLPFPDLFIHLFIFWVGCLFNFWTRLLDLRNKFHFQSLLIWMTIPGQAFSFLKWPSFALSRETGTNSFRLYY